MPRKRTGNILREGDHFVARVLLDDGKYARIHLPREFTKEQALQKVAHYVANPNEVATIVQDRKRQARAKSISRANRMRAKAKKKGVIKPKLHGKNGRALRTEKGRVVFHQHVVASLVTKTAAEIVKGKRRAAIYETKGCDGSDPVVRNCDVMGAQIISEPLPYVKDACE